MANDGTNRIVKKNPTIRSVAAAAGVSIGTASKFTNGKKRFSPDVEARLKVAIEDSGYEPDPQASYMITGKTCAIGLVILDIRNPHFTSVVKGANRVAMDRNYTLLLVDSEEDEGREKAMVKALAKRVDGLIVSSRLPDSDLDWLGDLDKPIIYLGRLENSSLSQVGVDSYLGAQLLAWHLFKFGHRNIAYLGFERSRWNAVRIRGIRDCLAANGTSLTVFDADSPDLHGGEASCAGVMLKKSPPDAVICYNDMIALGFMKAAKTLGLEVPRDVSVVGFDNIIYGEYFTPNLTTIDMRSERLGEVAMSKLLDRLSGKEVGAYPDLQPLLVARNSVRDRNSKADRPKRKSKGSPR